MSAIQVFESPEFGTLKTRKDDLEREYFRAIDACSILRLGNASVALQRHVSPENIFQFDDGTNRAGLTNYVNEPGFYELVFKAKTERAKAFQWWVFNEVLPKLRAGKPLDITRLNAELEEMQSNFEGLLAAKQYQLDSLTRSLTVQPELQPEREFLDLLETPKAIKFPYTLEDLHKASGISSKNYIGSIIKTSFKAEEDYTGFYWGQDKVTVKRMTNEVFTIMMLVLRSYRGADLLAMPSLICIERDRYYEANQKKAVNRRIQHPCPGQLDLF